MTVKLIHCCYALSKLPNTWPVIVSAVCHTLQAACFCLCFSLGGVFLAASALPLPAAASLAGKLLMSAAAPNIDLLLCVM